MLRLTFFIFCILLCTACGGALAGQLKRRRELLEIMMRDIRSIRAYIAYERLPLTAILEKLHSSRLQSLWDMALQKGKKAENGFGCGWQETISELQVFILSPLSEEELRILLEFGQRLATLPDIESQLRQIDMTQERLQLCLLEAKEEMHKKSRLLSSLGAMGGLAITIVLW